MKKSRDSYRMKYLSLWGGWAADHWVKTLLLALAIAAVLSVGIPMVKLEMTFYSMIPLESPQVRDLKQIIENFALIVAKSEVVKGLGLLAGMGIICEFLVMIILIPALLRLRNYQLSKKDRGDHDCLRNFNPVR